MTVIQAYKKRRNQVFGPLEDKPMFLHEDGSIYTKIELNSDLKELLALFPALDSPRDKWTGHSFRAGIATLLSIMGFTKEQIQSWGCWSSSAYLVYIKDQAWRRLTQQKLRDTCINMLSFINK